MINITFASCVVTTSQNLRFCFITRNLKEFVEITSEKVPWQFWFLEAPFFKQAGGELKKSPPHDFIFVTLDILNPSFFLVGKHTALSFFLYKRMISYAGQTKWKKIYYALPRDQKNQWEKFRLQGFLLTLPKFTQSDGKSASWTFTSFSELRPFILGKKNICTRWCQSMKLSENETTCINFLTYTVFP